MHKTGIFQFEHGRLFRIIATLVCTDKMADEDVGGSETVTAFEHAPVSTCPTSMVRPENLDTEIANAATCRKLRRLQSEKSGAQHRVDFGREERLLRRNAAAPSLLALRVRGNALCSALKS
mgnify:CR=1 FL=1